MNDIFDIDLGGAAEDGAPMTVVHPVSGVELTYDDNGQNKPIRIFLKGGDSQTFHNRMEYHMRKTGRNNRREPTLAEMADQSSDLLAHVTTGWEGIIWQGEPLPFSRENAKMVYKERPWLRRQVDQFVSESENFFEKSSTN